MTAPGHTEAVARPAERIRQPSASRRRWLGELVPLTPWDHGGPDSAGPVELPDDASSGPWWTLAGLTLIVWSLLLVGYVTIFPAVVLAVCLAGASGLALVLASWSPRMLSDRRFRAFGVWCLGVTLVSFGVWSYLQIFNAPGYPTDEIAFDQYAAHLVAHGLNPYVHSLAPAFTQFHVNPNNYTFHLDGTPETALSYPSLAFLLYVPFILLGWSGQVAVAINVAAWGLAMVLLYLLLPARLRPMSILLGSVSVYIAYAVGGVTDTLFVPLLVGAVVAWDRFPEQRGWTAWRGPFLLGLALAVKQTPWLAALFLVAGIAREGGGRTAARYSGIAGGAFLVPNLPFIVESPGHWITGVLTPFSSHNVPGGQGLVALSLFLHVGGGSIRAFSLAALAALVTLVCLYMRFYPRMKPWAVFLPAPILFLAARSFGSYLVTLLPAAIVAAATVRRSSPMPPWAGWRRAALAGGVATAAAGVAALTWPAPLAVTVVSVHTTGQLATVDRIIVLVKNHSGRALRPAFSLETGTTLTTFWRVATGPPVLGASQTATYTLTSPNFFSMPPIAGGFEVAAFTSRPATVSHSGAYLPTSYHLSLAPDAVDRPVPIGQPQTLVAQLLDHLDRRVAVSGVPVYLGQVIYAQDGLEFGEAIINGHGAGQTPVSALTDTSGRATFVIRGTLVSADPVYFEANLVNSTQYYPYGYSEIVPIRFK